MRESSELLYYICAYNRFTHAVELARFALFAELNIAALAVTAIETVVVIIGAIVGYDPNRGLLQRKLRG